MVSALLFIFVASSDVAPVCIRIPSSSKILVWFVLIKVHDETPSFSLNENDQNATLLLTFVLIRDFASNIF